MPILHTAKTATFDLGTLPRTGTWLFRIFGTWDTATANLQYSEDDAAYRDVEEAGLLLITADMTDPVSIIAGINVKFRLELLTVGSDSVSIWLSYSAAG